VSGEENDMREDDDLLQPSEGVEPSEEDVDRPENHDGDDEATIAPEEHIGLTPPD
jgi:hypothetical protein